MSDQPPNARATSLAASVRVFDLSLGEMLWSRRTIFMGLLVCGPLLLSAIFRAVELMGIPALRIEGARISGPSIFGMMIWVLYLRFIVPLLGVFYGTALIADEVEDKTLTYLFTRPIPRRAVLIGKYLAYLACTVLVVLPSLMVAYFLTVPIGGGSIASSFPALVVDLAILGLGLAVYGAVFAWIGALFKHPLVVGLVFIFGWEQAVLVLPGYLKRFTVAYYLQALVPHAMPQDSATSLLQAIFRDVPSAPASVAWLGVFLAVFLVLAARTVEQREYVLEQ